MEEQEVQKKSNTPIIVGVILVALVLLGAGGYFLLSGSQNTDDGVSEMDMTAALPTNAPSVEGTMNESDAATETGEVKEFSLAATNFEYDTTEIRVKAGDTVRITLKVEEGTHDFVVDEFSARTQVMEEGGEETIEFVAAAPGEYEYYCSVMQHRAMGMVGTLIVE